MGPRRPATRSVVVVRKYAAVCGYAHVSSLHPAHPRELRTKPSRASQEGWWLSSARMTANGSRPRGRSKTAVAGGGKQLNLSYLPARLICLPSSVAQGVLQPGTSSEMSEEDGSRTREAAGCVEPTSRSDDPLSRGLPRAPAHPNFAQQTTSYVLCSLPLPSSSTSVEGLATAIRASASRHMYVISALVPDSALTLECLR